MLVPFLLALLAVPSVAPRALPRVPLPDSVAATAPAPADSIAVLADSTAAPPDSTDDAIRIGFRVFPAAFYSVSKGFGAGGAVILKNVVTPGTEIVASAQPMQRYGRYRLSFFTSDPFHSSLFGGIAGEYVVDQVRSFYGLGPRTSRDDKIYTSLREAEVEVRVGWYPFGNGRLLLQPVARLLHYELRSFRDVREDAFLNLDAPSRRTLFDAVERPASGVTYGMEVALDGRDRLLYSSRGTLLLLTGRRYDGIGENAFRYWSGTASLYGFLPLPPERHVLVGRAVLAVTRQIGDEPLPFYALPVLDDKLLGGYSRYRFTGNDLLVLTAAYRFPLFTYLNWFALDASLAVSAANAYDNVFDQLEPGVTFDTDLRDEGERTPLRPALSLGLRLVDLEDDRIIIGGQLGIDPEGYRFGSIRLVYGIRDARPLVR